MLKFCVIVIFFALCGEQQAYGNVNGNDSMPIQFYPWDDESLKKIAREIDVVKTSMDMLNVRLEMQQLLFEKKFMKMDEYFEKTTKAETCENKRILEQEIQKKKFPSNCAEALSNARKSGLYSIKAENYGPQAFLVYCDSETQGGNWTLIQRRKDGSVDFMRKWNDYKNGFGNLMGEFFIGLDKLHALTTEAPQELLIKMQDFELVTKFAKYEAFAIGNEMESYSLNVLGLYSGDAGDSLTQHASQKFTTIDRDNDFSETTNCATDYRGAWWHNKCHVSNLNGLYLKGEFPKEKFAQGVVWNAWKGYYYSLKHVEMMIRPKLN